MTESNLDYPYMLNYSWVKDLDRVRANSKFVNHIRKGNQTPPAPVSQVLEIMRESMSRPEVLKACQNINESHVPPYENHILMWHNNYLRHKYGTLNRAVERASFFLRDMLKKKYSGLDDPQLKKDLLKKWDVCENSPPPIETSQYPLDTMNNQSTEANFPKVNWDILMLDRAIINQHYYLDGNGLLDRLLVDFGTTFIMPNLFEQVNESPLRRKFNEWYDQNHAKIDTIVLSLEQIDKQHSENNKEAPPNPGEILAHLLWPELYENPQVKDYERLKDVKNYKPTTRRIKLKELPKISIDDAFSRIRDHLSRPEIVAAYLNLHKFNDQVYVKKYILREERIIDLSNDYFDLKHDHKISIYGYIICLHDLMQRKYSGIDDSRLKRNLLSKPLIHDEELNNG